jgi:hypothetical protein
MIDVRKVRTLGKLLLKLETRSKNGSNRKLLLLNISYLLPGVFLPWLLLKQNTDPTGFEFAFLTFLFYSLILSFTIITELDNLIISKTEADLLTSMPIDDGLLVRAKMYMITRYLIFLCIPLLMPASIYYYAIINSIPRTFLYLASGFMLCFFTVNILILVYSAALRIFRSKKLSSYTLAFQLLMVFAMIIGYQFISFGITGKPGSSAAGYIHSLQAKGILDYFPQSWFALIAARNNYVPGLELILKLMLPLFICYMSYFTLKIYLVENYSYIREKFLSSKYFEAGAAKEKSGFFLFNMLGDFVQNVYLRSNLERSSFGLIRSLYRSDKTVKLAIIPMIIIPIGLALFALITNQLPAPFAKNYYETKPVFHISILLCVLVVLNTAILGVKVTNYAGVSWVYDSYPVTSRKHFKNGFRKFFVIYVILPVCILLGIMFLFKIPADQALIHTVFIFAAANLYNSVFNLLSRALPFTKENTLVNSLQRMTSILFPLLYGILIIVLQLFAYRSFLSAVVTILALFTITFWINYFGFVRGKRIS